MHDTIQNRVPRIVLLYWLIKISSITLGETGADMFSMTFEFGYGTTIAIFLLFFAITLTWKIRSRRYEPITYWLTFTSSAIAGTAISDFMDRTLEMGYSSGSLLLFATLLVVLALWYFFERSISVEQIHTNRSEGFYWMAFLIANTLGTAAGDFLADDLDLGFLFGSLLISGILMVTALLYYMTTISRVLLFWVAFVFTRPFGATFGDFLTKTGSEGGLNLGTTGTSLFFTIAFIVALAFEVRNERKEASGI